MGLPKDIRVVETMIGTRAGKLAKLNYTNLTGMKDKETEGFNFPAQYMFKDVPWSEQARNFEEEPEPLQGADLLLPYMEKHNIEIAMVGVGPGKERSDARDAIDNHPDRFIGCHEPDPMDRAARAVATAQHGDDGGDGDFGCPPPGCGLTEPRGLCKVGCVRDRVAPIGQLPSNRDDGARTAPQGRPISTLGVSRRRLLGDPGKSPWKAAKR